MALYFCLYKYLLQIGNNKQKKFNLTGITNRSKTFRYHISDTWPDGKIQYVEMRREKVEQKQNLPEMYAQNKIFKYQG